MLACLSTVDTMGHSLVDVGSSGEVLGVAPVIDGVLGLVHSYVVDTHSHRVWYVFGINRAEIGRLSQVHENILP